MYFVYIDAVNGADERLCMTPGQVVDAEVLDKILKQPEHCRVFYGPGKNAVLGKYVFFCLYLSLSLCETRRNEVDYNIV